MIVLGFHPFLGGSPFRLSKEVDYVRESFNRFELC